MSGDEVSDVDDAAYQVVVEPVTLVQPGPSPPGREFLSNGCPVTGVLVGGRRCRRRRVILLAL